MVVDVVVDVARELLLVRRGNVAGTRPGDLNKRYFITGKMCYGATGAVSATGSEGVSSEASPGRTSRWSPRCWGPDG